MKICPSPGQSMSLLLTSACHILRHCKHLFSCRWFAFHFTDMLADFCCHWWVIDFPYSQQTLLIKVLWSVLWIFQIVHIHSLKRQSFFQVVLRRQVSKIRNPNDDLVAAVLEYQATWQWRLQKMTEMFDKCSKSLWHRSDVKSSSKFLFRTVAASPKF